MSIAKINLGSDYNQNTGYLLYGSDMFDYDLFENISIDFDYYNPYIYIHDAFGGGDPLYIDLTLDLATKLSGGFYFDYHDRYGETQISGGVFKDYIRTGSGNDILFGDNGDDTLEGGSGGDELLGGAGIDIASYENSQDKVWAYLSNSVGNFGDAAGDIYNNIENLRGSDFNDILWGDLEANAIYGDDGADELNGGGGNDSLIGGAGNDAMTGSFGDDEFFVDTSADIVHEAFGQGSDTVFTTADYTLADGESIEFLRASEGSPSLHLGGNGENQAIIGAAGNDTLDGGAGADQLVGGTGYDTYIIDNIGDTIRELASNKTTNYGIDTVKAAISYTLGANLENLELTGADNLNGTGNALANTITGNDGSNILDGGAGVDQLVGGAGSDSFLVDNAGDRVFEQANGGFDTLITTVSYALAAGQEIEAMAIGTRTTSRGLAGNEFGQTLTGNNGDNRLDGKGGADVLQGGVGSDTFVFSSALDGSNIDTITDFAASTQTVHDRIELSQAVFSALSGGGTLDASAFKDISAGQIDVDDRILYDQSTGALSYDADGDGAGTAVQFALISNKAALTAADFFVA